MRIFCITDCQISLYFEQVRFLSDGRLYLPGMDIRKYAEQKGVPGAAEQYLVIDPVGVELPLASVGGMRSPE